MAILKAVSSHAPIGVAIDYVAQREKTEERLLSGIGVSPETAKDEMESTKELYGKTGGRTYKHFVQSFAPGEKITPEDAHKIAKEFADKCACLKGFEVLIATHKDREHIHTHFIVNSVNYEDGHKFQMSAHDLQTMKDLSDDICREHGLSICEKGKTFEGTERVSIVAWTKEKFQYLQKVIEEKTTKSYVRDTAVAVKEAMHIARSKSEFIEIMQKEGYSVDWQDRHKHITFTDPDGHKVRDTNLQKTFNLGVGKAELEEKFKENSISPIQEQISECLKCATRAHYRISEYTEAKTEIDKVLDDRRTRVEVCVEKVDRAARAIKAMKEEVRQLKAELDTCTSVQFLKRHSLQERIDHSKVLMDSIQADRDDFLKNYGFDSVDAMRQCTDDFYKAEKVADRVSDRICSEQKTYDSSISQVYDLKGAVKDDVQMTSEDREALKQELKEQFGTRYADDRFDKSEKAVLSSISSGEDDVSQKEVSVHDCLEKDSREMEDREPKREPEVQYKGISL